MLVVSYERHGRRQTGLSFVSKTKLAVVMDVFMVRFGARTQFPTAKKIPDSIRPKMRTMAREFKNKDGALVKALLAEAQCDPELATAFREK
jgi:hypothetical protein